MAIDPEEELFFLACQDMPVGPDEVREAMQAYRQHVLGSVLFYEMIDQHRPVIRQSPMVYNERMHDVQCSACDGNRWKMVLLGTDPIPECRFWAHAKKLGLVDGT